MGSVQREASEGGLRRIYRILASLAACDGAIVPAERAALQSFQQQAGILGHEVIGLEEEAKNLTKLAMGKKPREKKLLLEWMIEVVVADGVFDDAERRRMIKFAGPLGITQEEVVERIEARLRDPNASAAVADEFKELREELGLGPLWHPQIDQLPPIVRHGHGTLILRQTAGEKLSLDGIPIGDTGAAHPIYSGKFRGYFNVPPGQHLVATAACATEISIAPNEVEVLRLETPTWHLESDKARDHYAKLTFSGELLESKTLRPWPLPALYLWAGTGAVVARLNGVSLPQVSPCLAITDLAPGAYELETGGQRVRLDLPLETTRLVMLDDPTQDPSGYLDGIVRTALRRMPVSAIQGAKALGLR